MLVALASAGGCAYRPARFADRPPVHDVADDAPIAVPRRRVVHEPIWLADVYVRRPLMDALDAAVTPEAGDINALDEVPRSSWFDPDEATVTAQTYPGPPRPPLAVLGEAVDAGQGGFRVVDARGHRYEIRVDPADRPGLRTGAAVIASRLVRALGYRTPDVEIASLGIDDFLVDERARLSDGSLLDVEAILRTGPPPIEGRYRTSVTRWPLGIDLGPAPIGGSRDDDPNDRVPHRDRRTLRALRVIGAWLKLRAIGPRSIADAYLGPPGQGHVRHFLVGLDDALGAGDVVREGDPEPDTQASPLVSFLSLGFARSSRPPPTQTKMLAVGELSFDPEPERFAPPDPFEPMERLLPGDAYWAAKRISALSHEQILSAVRAAELDEEASAYLVEALERRRRTLVAHVYAKVSPLTAFRLEGEALTFEDRAIAEGFADPSTSTYEASFLGVDGREVSGRRRTSHGMHLALPASARSLDYLVIRLRVSRGALAAPRPVEVHIVRGGGEARIVGVRH